MQAEVARHSDALKPAWRSDRQQIRVAEVVDGQ
jgi:hypothetical protein